MPPFGSASLPADWRAHPFTASASAVIILWVSPPHVKSVDVGRPRRLSKSVARLRSTPQSVVEQEFPLFRRLR